MKVSPWLLVFGFALAAAGASYSYGQALDPFTMNQMGPGAGAPKSPGIDCNAEFGKRNAEMQKRGLALKTASERKANVKDACALFRRYTASETDMIEFLKKYTGPCQIPPEILKQMNANYSKSAMMRDQVCKAAAGQAAAPPPPPPSQGLSGALGGSGGPAPETPGGSGVFDSLTGNVLRQ